MTLSKDFANNAGFVLYGEDNRASSGIGEVVTPPQPSPPHCNALNTTLSHWTLLDSTSPLIGRPLAPSKRQCARACAAVWLRNFTNKLNYTFLNFSRCSLEGT